MLLLLFSYLSTEPVTGNYAHFGDTISLFILVFMTNLWLLR